MGKDARGKILAISPAVPRPDMNSGDLRFFSLLSILAMEHDIAFVPTTYATGDESYAKQLEESGVAVGSGRPALRPFLSSTRFEIAILEFYTTAQYYLDRIRMLQPDCRIVVDSVDVHYVRLGRKYELTRDGADLAAYRDTRAKELRVYRRADAVLTVTRRDAEEIAAQHRGIVCEVVPNIHEIRLGENAPRPDTLVFVGGFSHSPNVDAVLYFCDQILPEIRKGRPDVRVFIVGSNPPGEIRRLHGEGVVVTGHVASTTPYLHQSCVSVAPLRYGSGMKGKIGEAMAHGVPVVTTSVGAEGMGLVSREHAMIADSPAEFSAAVLELLGDSALYRHLRSNALRAIRERYTPTEVASALKASLARIRGRPVKRISLARRMAFAGRYVTERIRRRVSAFGG